MLLNPLIMQSTWIAWLSHFTCNRSSPTEPVSKYGSKSERAEVQTCVRNIARLHRFRFFSADITPTVLVYWLDYRKLNVSVSFREELNWWNYWKWRVKLSGYWGKYGTYISQIYLSTPSLMTTSLNENPPAIGISISVFPFLNGRTEIDEWPYPQYVTRDIKHGVLFCSRGKPIAITCIYG